MITAWVTIQRAFPVEERAHLKHMRNKRYESPPTTATYYSSYSWKSRRNPKLPYPRSMVKISQPVGQNSYSFWDLSGLSWILFSSIQIWPVSRHWVNPSSVSCSQNWDVKMVYHPTKLTDELPQRFQVHILIKREKECVCVELWGIVSEVPWMQFLLLSSSH